MMNDMEIEASNLRISINQSINPSQYAPAAWRRPPRAPLGYYPDSTDKPSDATDLRVFPTRRAIPLQILLLTMPRKLYHTWFDECKWGWNVRGKYVLCASILARNYAVGTVRRRFQSASDSGAQPPPSAFPAPQSPCDPSQRIRMRVDRGPWCALGSPGRDPSLLG